MVSVEFPLHFHILQQILKEKQKLKNIDVSQFPHLVLDAVLVALI